MGRRLLILGLVAAVLINGGCGTVCNLASPESGDRTFGGIRYDMEVIAKVTGDTPISNGPLGASGGQGDAALAVAFVVLPFLDLPLSFIGDIVIYPLTRWLDSPG